MFTAPADSSAPRHRAPLSRTLAAAATTAALLVTGFVVAPAASASAADVVEVSDAVGLASAFTAGGDIALARGFEVPSGEGPIRVGAGKSVSLDLNGHTLEVTGPDLGPGVGVLVGTTLSISDSSPSQTGHLIAAGGMDGAGIGGGFTGSSGTVKINGGHVTAVGGDGGAGVGGGYGAVGGVVEVSAGTLTATGKWGGAGIGGGDGWAGGTVTISGGTVTALGNEGSAGIGGGSGTGGDGGTVTITGGTVTATGGVSGSGEGGAAIGGGARGDGATVLISGGTVNALGGTDAPAIGGGRGGAGGALTTGPAAIVTVASLTHWPSVIGTGSSEQAFGSFSNAGTLNIEASSTLRIPAGTVVQNSGTMNVLATALGGINVAGILSNSGTINNAGPLVREGTGTISNGGSIFNTGSINPVSLVSGHNHLVTFNESHADASAPVELRVYAPSLSAGQIPFPAPTRTGYSLTGWRVSGSNSNWLATSTIPNGGMTLFAQWSLDEHTVTFNTGEGSDIPPATIGYNETVSEPDAPTLTGHTFAVWLHNGASWSFDTAITGDITLDARWTINNYTVTFANNGGTAIASVAAVYNTTVTAPTAPTRSGYRFTGWFSDSALSKPFSFSTKITKATTLYAGWATTTATLAFNMKSHGAAIATQTVSVGAVAKRPANPTASGYRFTGWFSDSAATKPFSFSSKITKNTTLYAGWIQTHAVAFNLKGHGSAIARQTVTTGSAATRPANPTASGYRFTGWYADYALTKPFSFSTKIATGTTVYAGWKKNYAVAFNLKGHGTAISKQTVTSGFVAKRPANPTASGYRFTGWYADYALTKPFSFGTKISKNTTVYAGWKKTYVVAFTMKGRGTAIAKQTIPSGSVAKAPATPTASGYTFTGWYADSALTKKFSFSTKIAKNTTVYAGWKKR